MNSVSGRHCPLHLTALAASGMRRNNGTHTLWEIIPRRLKGHLQIQPSGSQRECDASSVLAKAPPPTNLRHV
ncbi:hypothetical protein E2C01_069516 [Portunus trituberculatus]|uniref:Uncharacterized protein n=1 Tax=Portunus trituberculatus TaxID=210409 RepID=A0A5B7HQ91_PORTR|nr:hypothetical protein [Portunus trituberculatus]